MVTVLKEEVGLFDLTFRRRLRLYWTCYWRLVVALVIQTLVMLPVLMLFRALFANWPPAWLPKDSTFRALGSDAGDALAVLCTEVVSVVVAFALVVAYVQNILKARPKGVRFALVPTTADGNGDAKGP